MPTSPFACIHAKCDLRHDLHFRRDNRVISLVVHSRLHRLSTGSTARRAAYPQIHPQGSFGNGSSGCYFQPITRDDGGSVSDIFLYADETGNLDYNPSGNAGASKYFGVGTAVFDRDHGSELWSGMRLRAELSGKTIGEDSVSLPKGFHTKNDRFVIRERVFQEIASQQPRFDATFMQKSRAFGYVRERGAMWLYKYTFYRHITRVAQEIAANKTDTLYVIIATLGTAKLQKTAQLALEDVCRQTGMRFVLCVWDSASSWGLQVADYGLWAAQRKLEQNDDSWHSRYIKPLEKTAEFPWGK